MKIPGFTIEQKVGTGGTADVFAVRGPYGRKCALKWIHTRFSDQKDIRRRFEREAALIGSLKHPNIVQLIDHGMVTERFFMVLEFLGGGSLAEFTALTPRRRLKTMIQICDGVALLHDQGVVHRDLKPNNIMFGDDGIPRLVDFGVALFLKAELTRLTQTQMMLGTLAYMSPEQQTTPSAIDHRSDIYALGAILYELFTGRKPVGRFEDPSWHHPQFDPRLEALILKCLKQEKNARFSHVLSLQEALIQLWNDGLFKDASSSQATATFDLRLGYWLQQLRLGNERLQTLARQQLKRSTKPQDITRLLAIAACADWRLRRDLMQVLAQFDSEPVRNFLEDQRAIPQLHDLAIQLLAKRDEAQA